MSIASEIQDLQTNLQAAKSAVTTKGGTVGDTGLAGLATEIATIPSGGSLDNYGSIKYLDGNNVEQTLTLATEDDYLELTVGGSGSNILINNVTVNKSNITEVVIADGVQYIPDSFCSGCNYLTSATIPSSVHVIGYNAFAYNNITTASFDLQNVHMIGTSFLTNNTNFNTAINLPKVKTIGSNFLNGCSSFNSSITINDDCQFIDSNFLRDCTSFAQSFSIPSGLSMNSRVNNPGGYFMNNCQSFVGPLVCNCPPTALPSSASQKQYILATNNATALMYTTGITLTGTYANDWKTALPDKDTSPYRKLIVGS